MIYANKWNLTGTTQQQQIVKEALDQIKFPWERLKMPSTYTEIGWRNLNLQFEDPEELNTRAHQGGTIGIIDGRKYVLGVFYTHSGRIYIDEMLVKYPDMAKATVSAEIAHAVDYFLPLTDLQRNQLMALMHGGSTADHGHSWWEKFDYSAEYFTLVGESFMQAFTLAYSDMEFDSSNFTHSITKAQAPEVRRIMGVERTDQPTTSTSTTKAPTTTSTTTVAPSTSTSTTLAPTTTSTTTVVHTTSTSTTTTIAQAKFFAKIGAKVYHDSHINIRRKIADDQLVEFNSKSEAEAAGLRACKVCKP